MLLIEPLRLVILKLEEPIKKGEMRRRRGKEEGEGGGGRRRGKEEGEGGGGRRRGEERRIIVYITCNQNVDITYLSSG